MMALAALYALAVRDGSSVAQGLRFGPADHTVTALGCLTRGSSGYHL